MKLIGIVGANASLSYNRKLLEFMKKHFSGEAEIELIESGSYPLFNQDDAKKYRDLVNDLSQKIMVANGIIIACPEHNHTITSALKSLLEWLSFEVHPLKNKPVMIVGGSYYDWGSTRAQLDLRQILDSPGVSALCLPGNEFLLENIREAFDSYGNLVNQETITFLDEVFQNFLRFASLVNTVQQQEEISNSSNN